MLIPIKCENGDFGYPCSWMNCESREEAPLKLYSSFKACYSSDILPRAALAVFASVNITELKKWVPRLGSADLTQALKSVLYSPSNATTVQHNHSCAPSVDPCISTVQLNVSGSENAILLAASINNFLDNLQFDRRSTLMQDLTIALPTVATLVFCVGLMALFRHLYKREPRSAEIPFLQA